ncbi:T9SS type A sorting domain-containing protein [Chryseobacterium jejuense]|uniref:Delta-60 repeat domain n=1 Tax=Chryseobacterium jejuense TaxID=445960 RepID=A0A2X2WI36_CHRJE|nr:T9SS type A sorting domain-containing protein [Chryseobacterium jejuense]SDJ68029.1 delta-60 repeat domain-containing protein/Por secretion system C-terminal sorting domain-containing protein [Chryseobacterium jejuense]SQB43042.1 delta-60 repeat domain [Chryseobacterium jejuense]
MKKNLLLVTLVTQAISAQITSYDNNFASHGKYTIAEASSSHYNNIVQNSDGSLYFTYIKQSAATEVVLSKLNPNGTVDTSFGLNGEVSTSYASSGFPITLKKQADGKIVILGFYEDGTAITRILPNGQIDAAFGTNGTAKIPYIGASLNVDSFGFHLQNNKIIVYGNAFDSNYHLLDYSLVYRLNENGSIDQTFGNNGSINTKGRFVFVDNQTNIVSLARNSSTYPYGALEKYDSNGQVLSAFGNNGVTAFPSSPGLINTAIMDSNNFIVCINNIDNEIFRINPNGSRDNSFVFDNTTAPFNDGNLSASITEKNGSYYISWITGATGETFLISKLTSTGAIDPSFNYYSESSTDPIFIGNMLINEGNIFAVRGKQIFKFIVNNNATLATADFSKASRTSISFENPIKQHLIYDTKETVQSIEIYSTNSKLIKTVQNNNANVSDLPTGIYIVKIRFANGKETTKKLMKN